VEEHHPTTATRYVENTTDIKRLRDIPQLLTTPPESPTSTHPTAENSYPSDPRSGFQSAFQNMKVADTKNSVLEPSYGTI